MGARVTSVPALTREALEVSETVRAQCELDREDFLGWGKVSVGNL
jgi:hypothetical protein